MQGTGESQDQAHMISTTEYPSSKESRLGAPAISDCYSLAVSFFKELLTNGSELRMGPLNSTPEEGVLRISVPLSAL